jgi:hypothetical protein
MIGHVGDFGLARFAPEADHNSSTNQSSSIGVRGTIGYAAPGKHSLSFVSYSLFSSKNMSKFEHFFIIKNFAFWYFIFWFHHIESIIA